MELTDSFRMTLIETAETLRGAGRRRFMAQSVQTLGRGGQRRAEAELGWNRATSPRGPRSGGSGWPVWRGPGAGAGS
jgi:hypothetical protein